MWDIYSASAANKNVQVNQILELRSEKKRLPSLLKGKSPKMFKHGLVLVLQGYLSGSRSRQCREGCRCACIQAAVRIYQHNISTHSLSAGRGSVFHLSTHLFSFDFQRNWRWCVCSLISMRWERFCKVICMFWTAHVETNVIGNLEHIVFI